MSFKRMVPWFCLIVVLFSVSCADQRRIKALIEIEKIIDNYKVSYNIHGLAVALADEKRPLLVKAYGKADKDKDFTPDTISNVGSVSKIFAALAMAHLSETGQIDLDKPLLTYVPDFKPQTWGPDPKDITIRSLLCHQSGLPSDYFRTFFTGRSFKELDPKAYTHTIEDIAKSTICTEPYIAHSYSNLAYSLLALVIENVTTMPFNEYMLQEIFHPLGMKRTSFLYDPALKASYSKGVHFTEQGPVYEDIPGIPILAAGSMLTSAKDLAQFITALLRTKNTREESFNKGPLTPQLIKAMWTRQNSESLLVFDHNQMMGWYGIPAGGASDKEYLGHGGSLTPFGANLMIDPEENIGVFIMINAQAGVNLYDMAKEILETMSLTKKRRDPDPEEQPGITNGLPREVLETFSGNWASPSGLFSIVQHESGLKVRFGARMQTASYHGQGVLTTNGIKMKLKLKAHKIKDKTFLVLLSDIGFPEILTKVEPIDLDPAWLGRLGKWKLIDEDKKNFPERHELIIERDTSSTLYCVKDYNSYFDSYINFPIASRNVNEIYKRGYGRGLGETIQAYTLKGTTYLDYCGLRYVME